MTLSRKRLEDLKYDARALAPEVVTALLDFTSQTLDGAANRLYRTALHLSAYSAALTVVTDLRTPPTRPVYVGQSVERVL